MNVLDLDINTAIEKYLVRSFERAGFETKIIKINDGVTCVVIPCANRSLIFRIWLETVKVYQYDFETDHIYQGVCFAKRKINPLHHGRIDWEMDIGDPNAYVSIESIETLREFITRRKANKRLVKRELEAAVNMLLQPEIHEVPPCY